MKIKFNTGRYNPRVRIIALATAMALVFGLVAVRLVYFQIVHGEDLLATARENTSTTITVQVYISETYLPQGRKPHTRKYKRTLVLQRARYPKRRQQDGKFFTERECPSCGANFIPDENHCCSFCGYSFQVNNAKWVVQKNQA